MLQTDHENFSLSFIILRFLSNLSLHLVLHCEVKDLIYIRLHTVNKLIICIYTFIKYAHKVPLLTI